MKYFIYSVIGLVLVVIVAGFFVLDAPSDVRLKKLDDRRISDLQNIRWNVQNFWESQDRLPEHLEELRGFSRVTTDPETGDEYGYIIEDEVTFSLCATFALPSEDFEKGRSIAAPVIYEPAFFEDDWNHGEGRVCFERHALEDRFKREPAEVLEEEVVNEDIEG